MTTLHLGVQDLPYAYSEVRVFARRRPARVQSTTTGDVAEILESKYHLMETFYEMHQADIARSVENALGGALENMLIGAPPPDDPFAAASGDIKTMFSEFLLTGEAERVGIPGTPTKAAQAGVSHRFKHPYAQRAARPSFVDTGLLESSFTAWVD